MDGLRCIDNFTFRCLDREHRAYFNTLYAGTTQVIVDLCTEGSYQTDYLRHAPCMREVQNGYERCAADYQYRIKNLNSKQENGGDNERNRGSSTPPVVLKLLASPRVFLDRMSGPLIQGHCQAYEQGLNENCFSENYSDSGYSPSSSSGSSSSSEQSRGSLQNPFFFICAILANVFPSSSPSPYYSSYCSTSDSLPHLDNVTNHYTLSYSYNDLHFTTIIIINRS
ncbi:unnamed protein product [Lepeophtheirus salmonis]|uniref:(salmon louse) hypothetical protein n=1 Tax=Lepeophtheirus salmonis TaxID=72036 RepID=A0A7R8CJJ1_LEPSM|nr:unnamed protein product [Lepeophtheirus salmonis]CAF2793194.1 unnamed protein product [Lepeophtheirus salmonis]